MGGEDPEADARVVMARLMADQTNENLDDAQISSRSSDEDAIDYDRPRPPLVGEAAAEDVQVVQRTFAVARTSPADDTTPDATKDSLADKVESLLKKTVVHSMDAPQTSMYSISVEEHLLERTEPQPQVEMHSQSCQTIPKLRRIRKPENKTQKEDVAQPPETLVVALPVKKVTPPEIPNPEPVVPSKSPQLKPHQPEPSRERVPSKSPPAVITFTSREHERQFINLMGRKRSYLKCLQKELTRLEKMEKALATFYTKEPILLSSPESGSAKSAESTPCCSLSGYQTDASSGTSNPTIPNVIPHSAFFVCRKCAQRRARKNSERSRASPKRTKEKENSSHRTREYLSTKDARKAQVKEIRPALATTSVQTTDSLLNLESHISQQSQPAQSSRQRAHPQKPTKPKEVHVSPTPVRDSSPNEEDLRAWFIPLETKRPRPKPQSSTNVQRRREPNPAGDKREVPDQFAESNETTSLQEAFRQRCSHVMQKSLRRQHYISTKAQFRKNTAEQRIAAMTDYYRQELVEKSVKDSGRTVAFAEASDARGMVKMKRVFTHKEMRRQTERIYTRLPEVRDRINQKKKADGERLHRLMAQIYTNSVQRNALKGRIDFPITKSLITY